jgi:2-polyprenyl-3-methyl-5-hydroxy-6-metoxy-1,4-benzoquinol methylase
MREQAEINKTAWEHRAYEMRNTGRPVQEVAKEILDDPKSFLRYHQKYFDDIAGKRIANVCGSDGRRTIPFAVLGAEATLFDISEPQLKYASELAEAAGVNLECVPGDFIETDIIKYGSMFDMLYMEGGILHYFSDIDAFTKTLYAITKPGGRMILCDMHPYRKLDVLGLTEGDYFDTRLHYNGAPLRGFAPEEEQDAFPKILVRLYTISEIINSVINAGFTLKEFTEHNYKEYKDGKIPPEFTIIADK